MLTDIFAFRYDNLPMWDGFEERDRRFIVQAFRIVEEQLYPPFSIGKKSDWADAKWKTIHDRLSTELGHHLLSPRSYSYDTTYAGKVSKVSGTWSWDYVCKQYVCKEYQSTFDADSFIKNRLSFVEIAFRERESDVKAANANLPVELIMAKANQGQKLAGLTLPGSRVDALEAANKEFNDKFRAAVDELNERLRQAGYKLNYHNGFIQISIDEKVEEQIETPFWALVADPKWSNVDTDMKEAIDRRDGGRRDPSFPAAKALESTIKIISKEKGWNTGSENGAHNFIDNLVSKNNGRFIGVWEAESMKHFFTYVRNPLGHGPGGEKMPELDRQQTDWAIEFCMSWIKSLIQRM